MNSDHQGPRSTSGEFVARSEEALGGAPLRVGTARRPWAGTVTRAPVSDEAKDICIICV